ncbi:MAG: 4Fe-4S dicluster domain-containing protein [Chloroflexi bacterium]|nr:4Fe-4S dicluster domain-containing protein [Chloroflexota bacterium]
MPDSVVTRKGQRLRILLTPRYCKGCGICVELCPAKVFGSEPATGKAYLAAVERCVDCGLCELWCPDYAISLEREANL